eukprot:g1179.t1
MPDSYLEDDRPHNRPRGRSRSFDGSLTSTAEPGPAPPRGSAANDPYAEFGADAPARGRIASLGGTGGRASVPPPRTSSAGVGNDHVTPVRKTTPRSSSPPLEEPSPQTSPHWGPASAGSRQPYTPVVSSGMYNKLKYYRQLEGGRRGGGPGRSPVTRGTPSPLPSPGSRLSVPPPHVLPSSVYMATWVVVDSAGPSGGASPRTAARGERPRQSSLATVASIWNTMIGSTLVTLPYGFAQAGMLVGTAVVLLMGSVCCYTCVLVIRHGSKFPDFTDFTRHYFGRRGQVLAMVASVLVLTGALVAYHILMAQNLDLVVQELADATSPGSAFAANWNMRWAAVCILAMFPLTIAKDAAQLVKLNSCGVLFCVCVILFIVYHGALELHNGIGSAAAAAAASVPQSVPTPAPTPIAYVGGPSFGVLAGIASLSFFIHNAIHPILRNAVPERRVRDTCTAYALVGVCYLAVGLLGYVGFGDKPVTQNFLAAFAEDDWLAFGTRFAMFLQLITVYPLILFIVRTQLFGILLKTQWPGRARVVCLNAGVMALSTLCAALDVPLARVLGLTGAICSFALVYCIPVGAHLKARDTLLRRAARRRRHDIERRSQQRVRLVEALARAQQRVREGGRVAGIPCLDHLHAADGARARGRIAVLI